MPDVVARRPGELLRSAAVMRAPQIALALAYLIHDGLRVLWAFVRGLMAPARAQAAAEARRLFLARQLALYQEREAPRSETSAPVRLAMVFLSRFFDWRGSLVIVKPETLIRWHRDGFKALWRR